MTVKCLSSDSAKLCKMLKDIDIVKDVAKLIKAKRNEDETVRKVIQKEKALNEETDFGKIYC